MKLRKFVSTRGGKDFGRVKNHRSWGVRRLTHGWNIDEVESEETPKEKGRLGVLQEPRQ